MNLKDTQDFSYGKEIGKHFPEVLESELTKTQKRNLKKINETFSAMGVSITITSDIHTDTHGFALHKGSGDIFTRTQISDSSYYLRVVGDIPTDSNLHFNIVSGPCLFDIQAVIAITEDGSSVALTDPKQSVNEKISRIEVDHRITPYELEAVLRLTSVIKDLILASDNPTKFSVYLNVPREEYYLYALDAYVNGHLTNTQLLSWMDEVDRRHEKIKTLMTRRLPAKTDIRTSAPLSQINNYLRTSVENNSTPQLQVAILILSENPLWNEILKVKMPSSWQELNYLSYVFAELNAGQTISSSATTSVCVAVENPIESRIARESMDTIKTIPPTSGKFNLVGIYPHEQELPNDGKLWYFTSRDDLRRTYGAILAHHKWPNI